jgi:hypothetical protein
MLVHISQVYPNIAMFPPFGDASKSLPASASVGTPAIQPNTTNETHMEDAPPVPEVPYDGYETDPPAHYPKANQGLGRALAADTEDMPWLIDDNFEVFNQMDYDGNAGAGASHGQGVVQSGA